MDVGGIATDVSTTVIDVEIAPDIAQWSFATGNAFNKDGESALQIDSHFAYFACTERRAFPLNQHIGIQRRGFRRHAGVFEIERQSSN